MSRDTHHVIPNSEKGGWDVRRSGAVRASIHVNTKKEAESIARTISKKIKGLNSLSQ